MKRLLLLALLLQTPFALAESFVAFESLQFRPLALSQNGRHLFAVNTPDNRLEVFDIQGPEPRLLASVPVGLEPIAVAVRNPREVWVVNHLSDSVSIVELGWPYRARVKRTLWVGDEPRDIVFAGEGRSRAFITAAHRGQNSPYTDSSNPAEAITPGIGRTDVWIFDANDPGAGPGGTPLEVKTFFGDTAGPLASNADGSEVYVGVFKSGNRTTTLTEPLLCNGGAEAEPCFAFPGEAQSPGGVPGPNADIHGVIAPEVGLIVRNDGSAWRDELGRDWSGQVRFSLPDLDVFRMQVGSGPVLESGAYSGVGTTLFGMAVDPTSGNLFVSNTEARNEVRFAGLRDANTQGISTVNGHLAEARITVIDPATATVMPRHLNKHIDYSIVPAPPGVKERSLANPQGIAFSPDGSTLFVAAMGSDRIGVFDVDALQADTFEPDADAQVVVTGGGPTGVVADPRRDRLYVMTRYDNGLSVIDTTTLQEIAHVLLPNPEPAAIRNGRRFLYDARIGSSNGEASCAACHIAGDKDELAWDLGDPAGSVVANTNPFIFRPPPAPPAAFHPMKGPMTTQTLRGMANQGPMHWRGDKSGALEPGGDAFDTDAAFKQFNIAFVDLQGSASELDAADMQSFTDFALRLTPPPNPIRNLDNSLNTLQAAGRDAYFNSPINAFGATCNTCHVLDAENGFFGSDGRSVFTGAPNTLAQADFVAPQLRNMYEKVGMFGMPATPVTGSDNTGFTGEQIRGFGYMRDGAFDTLFRRLDVTVFDMPGGDTQRRAVEQFMLAFDSELKPIVGQQVTLGRDSGSEANARVDLLIERALAGDADLVVRGQLWGSMIGWLLQDDGRFRLDFAAGSTISEQVLRSLANFNGSELTFTAVPVGSGYRIALDRDADGILDGDECGARRPWQPPPSCN